MNKITQTLHLGKGFPQLSWLRMLQAGEPQSRMGSRQRCSRQGCDRARDSPVFTRWEAGCVEPEGHVGKNETGLQILHLEYLEHQVKQLEVKNEIQFQESLLHTSWDR